jgi:hypothetical protein
MVSFPLEKKIYRLVALSMLFGPF